MLLRETTRTQANHGSCAWQRLDFLEASAQIKRMPPILTSFYARWRVNAGVVPLLKEDLESPPEYLLQAVWQHQRLLRDELKSADGTPVKILHPGFRSVEGGPDFR